MHDLALCTVHSDGDVLVDGFVRAFADGVLTIAASGLVLGLTPGDDVTVRVLDDVRGECLYAGYVSRVASDRLDVAELELVSTLQKRAVVRVHVAVACHGTVLVHGARPEPEPEPEPAVPAPDADDVASEPAAPAPEPEPSHEMRFTMLDVSAQGMRILARAELTVGSMIRFRFEELDAPFLISAVVVRREESRTGTHYGCRFTGATARQTDSLFGYVLRTQGDQRRDRLRV
jgi:hypothetical protein